MPKQKVAAIYPPRNPDGSVKLPDCLLKARARLDAGRKNRAEQLRDQALAARMESWLLEDVAQLMTQGCLEIIARAQLLYKLGFSRPESINMACDTTPGASRPNKTQMARWLRDWKAKKVWNG